MNNAFEVDVKDGINVVLELSNKFGPREVSKISSKIRVIYENYDFSNHDLKFVAKKTYFKKHCCGKMIVLIVYVSKKTCTIHKNWVKHYKLYLCSCSECNYHYYEYYDD